MEKYSKVKFQLGKDIVLGTTKIVTELKEICVCVCVWRGGGGFLCWNIVNYQGIR
jgi:hypothetical protein